MEAISRLGHPILQEAIFLGSCSSYLAPATSKMGLRKFRRRNRPDVNVAAPTNDHRRISMGKMQKKDMGMKTLREYPALCVDLPSKQAALTRPSMQMDWLHFSHKHGPQTKIGAMINQLQAKCQGWRPSKYLTGNSKYSKAKTGASLAKQSLILKRRHPRLQHITYHKHTRSAPKWSGP